MRKKQYLGDSISPLSSSSLIEKQYWREFLPYLLLGMALLLMLVPFGNAHATTLNVCYKTNTELDLDRSSNVNTRAKLTNSDYFGPTGTAAPEDFSFTTLGTINASTLASCDIFFGGGSPQLNATEATAVKTWVQAGSRFLIAGCDYSSNNVCSTFGRGLTANSNGGVSIVSTLSYNPLACGGALSVGTYGGASTYHGTLAGDEILATHDGAPAGQTGAAITDGLVTPTFLFTADADMYGSSGSSAIGSGAVASTDQAKLVVNSFKYAADAIGGRLVSPQCFASYDNTADLAISSSLTNSSLTVGDQTTVSFTVTNETATAVTNVAATISLPSGISYASQTGDGSYSDASKIWTIGALAGNASATITLTIDATGVVSSNITAEITSMSLADTDSSTNVGFGVDDKNDGLADDDETSQAITSALGWPTPPVIGPGDGGECVLTHHTNAGVLADPNSFYNISDHTNPNTLTKIGPWNVASGTVEGLTANVASETFYALNANRGGKLWLGELDPVTGSFSDITTTGSAALSHSSYGSLSIHQSRAIAHQPGTNELWVAAYDAQPTSGPGATYVYLFKISTTTGEVLTGAFAGEDYMAINLAPYTFNSSNDRPSVEALTFYKNEPNILYGVLSTLSGGTPKVGHLFAIDLSLASPQAVLAPNNLSGVVYSGGAAPTSDHYDIEGMSFDQNGDLVIVSSNIGGANANSLFTVDLATGTASNKRSIISGDWEGIVCDPFLPGKDYGDAPVSGASPDGSSTNAYGEASHIVVSGTYLGAADPDVDVANQPSISADGDDNNGSDDEDGINSFPSLYAGNLSYTLPASNITAGGSGTLHAWIDFNGNGSFESLEHASTTVSNGTLASDLSFSGFGSTMNTGITFARFRLTSDVLTDNSGTTNVDERAIIAASDGEVEDYAIAVEPFSFTASCTASGSGDAYLDETLLYNLTGSIKVARDDPSQLLGAPDYDGHPDDDDPEQFTSVGPLGSEIIVAFRDNILTNSGDNSVDISIREIGAAENADVYVFPFPETKLILEEYGITAESDGSYLIGELRGTADLDIDVVFGNFFTQGRLQFGGIKLVTVLDSTGDGPDIDAIEAKYSVDCNALRQNSDYSDAPISYGEASHIISGGSLYLGATAPDIEASTRQGGDNGLNADGDDSDGIDDEDGIQTFPGLNDLTTNYSINVAVTNTSGNVANLVGWIDFDGNGIFDADEAATVSIANNTTSTVALAWNVPGDITVGTSYLRLRLTSDTAIATGTASTSVPSGMAQDGEVEDYALSIELGGFPVKGRVYIDTDVDGSFDAGEKGISDLPVVLMKVESNPANNTCVSVRTDAEGNYEFFPVLPGNYQLYEASRETVPTPQNCGTANAKDPAGYRSTTNNVLTQFSVVDAEIMGKDFGDVKTPSFSPDHVGSVLPGNVTFYAHKFTTQSTGTVSFVTANSGGATNGWSSTLYQDTDCNGQLDGNEATAPVAANLATTAGSKICLINKVYAPGNVTGGETWSNSIAADFDYGNAIAGSITLNATDLTKVASNDPAGSSRLELKKTVQTYQGAPLTAVSAETETQNAAQPGDLLRYRIYYSNTGNGPLTELEIKDVVPAFTTLSGSPVCEMPLPDSLSSCVPTVNGDDILWAFPANDELKAGAAGMVSYDVIIE